MDLTRIPQISNTAQHAKAHSNHVATGPDVFVYLKEKNKSKNKTMPLFTYCWVV